MAAASTERLPGSNLGKQAAGRGRGSGSAIVVAHRAPRSSHGTWSVQFCVGLPRGTQGWQPWQIVVYDVTAEDAALHYVMIIFNFVGLFFQKFQITEKI